jgi:hypothetical protein
VKPCEALGPQRQALQRCARVAAQEKRLCRREIRLGRVAIELVGRGQQLRLVGGTDGLLQPAEGAVQEAEMAEHVELAPDVAGLAREVAGLLQPVDGRDVIARDHVGEPKLAAHVDGQPGALGGGGQRLQRLDGALEIERGGAVGGPLDGALGGLGQVAGGGLPLAGAVGVGGELLDVLGDAVGVQALDRGQRLGVGAAALLAKERGIGHPADELVAEGVFRLAEGHDLEQELGALEHGERPGEPGVVEARERLQERARRAAADHGGGLQERPLSRGQPLDARGDHRLDAGRGLDLEDGLGRDVCAGAADDAAGFLEGEHGLLDEERRAVGALDQEAPERRDGRVLAEQAAHERLRVLDREGV